MARDLAALRNDLEPPAVALRPVIGEVLAALRATPGCLLARMSGSGATCFGCSPTPPRRRRPPGCAAPARAGGHGAAAC